MSVDDFGEDVRASIALLERALDSRSWCTMPGVPTDLVWGVVLEHTGRVVRRLRGRKMRTWPALMDEVGAALQFGDYFGENYPALDECLCDLDWLPTDAGYVLVVENPEQVLVDDESPAEGPSYELAALVQILARAADTFAEPIELGEVWDRPAVAFDVVLVPKPEDVERTRARWSAAGAPLD